MYYILHSQSKPEKKCYQENNKRKYIHSTILYLSKKKITGKGTCAVQTCVIHGSTGHFWQNYVGLPGNT